MRRVVGGMGEEGQVDEICSGSRSFGSLCPDEGAKALGPGF